MALKVGTVLNLCITRCITRKYPQQFLICIVSDWVLVAVDAGVRLQVNMINLMLGDCLERMKEIPDGVMHRFSYRWTLEIEYLGFLTASFGLGIKPIYSASCGLSLFRI